MNVRFREKATVPEMCAFTKTSPVVSLMLIALFSPTTPASPAIALPVPLESIEQLALQAEQLEQAGKWEDAESIYHKILGIDPRSIAAINRLGAIEVGWAI